jgi:hypothetical protein
MVVLGSVPLVVLAESEPNDDASNADSISIGVQESGTLTSDDIDWFSFSASRGQSVEVTASRSSAEATGYRITLWNPDVNSIVSEFVSPGETAVIGEIVEVTGTYYISVDGDSGSYDFTADTLSNDGFEPNEGTSDAVAYTVGDTQTGSLTPSDIDWFSFDATRAESLEITASRSSTAASGYRITLLNPNANSIVSEFVSPGETAVIGEIVEVTGTYYITVDGDSGSYDFTVNTLTNDGFEPNEGTSDAVPYTLGETQTGNLTPSDIDWFSFDATRGESLELTASRSSVEATGYRVTIYDPNVNSIVSEFISPSETASIGEIVEVNGTYYVSVDGDSGNYQFTLDTVPNDGFEPNERFEDAVAYTLGETQTGNLTPSDIDIFSFDAERGQSLEVDATRASAATSGYRITLFNANGQSLSSQFVSPGETERAGDVIEVDGTYYLNVDGDSGTYDFTATARFTDAFEPNERLADAYALFENPRGPIQANLTFADEDWFAVQATAGDTINVTGSRSSGESSGYRVTTFNPAGSSLISEFISPGETTTTSVTASTTGTYYVDADGDEGVYSTGVTVNGEQFGLPNDRFERNEDFAGAAAIVPGVFFDLAMVDDDRDYFAINAVAGDRIDVAVDSNASVNNLTLQLYNPGQTLVRESATGADREEISFTATQNGTHYVAVTGEADRSDTYALFASVVGTVDVTLGPGADSIGPGNTNVYDVVVTGADTDVGTVNFTAESSNTSVVTFTGATAINGTAAVSVAPDGSSLTFNATNLSIPGGNAVTVARVTVQGNQEGSASVNITGTPEIRTVTDAGYPVNRVQGTDVTVVGAVDVTVGPGTDSLAVGDTPTYDVTVAGIDPDVASVDFELVSSDASVLAITGVSAPAGTPTVTVAQDGSSATVSITGIGATSTSSVVATVSASANAVGLAELNISGTPTIQTSSGLAYPVTPVQGTSVTSTGSLALAVGPGTDGSLQPTNTTTYNVTATGDLGDVGSFSLDIASSNTTVLQVTGVSASGTLDATVAPDGSSVSVNVTGASISGTPGSPVIIAQVSVIANATGEATLNISGSPAVATTGGIDYTVAGVSGTVVTVSTDSLPAEFQDGIPGSSTGLPPQDTNGDGKLDDMTGDGRFTFQDVIEFVFALDNIRNANLSPQAIALLDQDDSGSVTFVDVIDLVFQL